MQSLGIELPYYLRYFNMADDFAGGINNETMYKDEYKPWKPVYNKETFQHYDFNIYIKPNAHIIDIYFYGVLGIISKIGGLMSSIKIGLVLALTGGTLVKFKRFVAKQIKKEVPG